MNTINIKDKNTQCQLSTSIVDDSFEKYSIYSRTDDSVILLLQFTQKSYYVEYRNFKIEEIAEYITAEGGVNLSYCYIDCESFMENLNCNFTAHYSFFNGYFLFNDKEYNHDFVVFDSIITNGGFDFSESCFVNCKIEFFASIISAKKIDFSSTTLTNSSISLYKSNILDCVFNFSHATVQLCKLNLGCSNYKKCKFDFWLFEASKCEISLDASNYEIGELDWSDAKLVDNSKISIVTVDIDNIKICFKGCVCDEVVMENGNFSNFNDFRFSYVGNLKIHNCFINGSMPISGFENISFNFSDNLGRIVFTKDAENVIKKISCNDDTIESKLSQLVMLKENFHNCGYYDLEDESFVAYMRLKRKLDKPFGKLFSWIFDFIGDYGTNPTKVILRIIMCWFIFGIIFSISTICGGLSIDGTVFVPNASNLLTSLKAFYFSGITLTTIGYGDISPANLFTQVFAPLEGAFGIFLFSYLAVAVVRKTLR